MEDAERIKSMKQEVNPQETTRAYAFEMWMNAPAASFLDKLQKEIDNL